MKEELREVLEKHIQLDNRFLFYQEYEVKQLTNDKVKASIIHWGNLLEEDNEHQIYVAVKNLHGKSVSISIKILNDRIYMLSHAREGLINIHTADKESKRLIDMILSH